MDFWSLFAMYGFAYLIVNGLLALIPAFVAEQRGRSAGAFWALSFFFTLIVGLLVVMALPVVESPRSRASTSGSDSRGQPLTETPEEVKCPGCAEYIKFEAKICRFCGTEVSKDFEQLAEQIANNKAVLLAASKARESELKELEEKKAVQAAKLAADRARARKEAADKITGFLEQIGAWFSKRRISLLIGISVAAVIATVSAVAWNISVNTEAVKVQAQKTAHVREYNSAQKQARQAVLDATTEWDSAFEVCGKGTELGQSSKDSRTVAFQRANRQVISCVLGRLGFAKGDIESLLDEATGNKNSSLKHTFATNSGDFVLLCWYEKY